MGLFDYIKNKINPPKNYTEDELKFLHALGLTPNDNDVSNEVVFYTCCKLISESIAKMGIHLYQKKDGDRIESDELDIAYLLKVRPNPYTSPIDLISMLMQNTLRTGNGFIWIKYKGYKPVGLYNLESNRVKILIDNNSILKNKKIIYEYTDYDNKTYLIDSDDIIHISTSDKIGGLVGKSILETLADTLKTSKEATKYLNNLYKNNLSAKSILYYTGDLNKESEERLVRGLEKYTGNNSNNTILPLPLGMELKPLTLSLVDAQFLESKEANALNIAAAMGVSPTFLNVYKNSSYNNTSQESLRFLNMALQYYITAIEQELNYKCLSKNQIKQGYYLKLNVSSILRTDPETQANILVSYVTNGIYTVNEARILLDKNKLEDGDNAFLNGSFTTLTNASKGIAYGQESIKDDKGGDNDNDKLQE